MVRVAGTDPGTSSLDLIVLENGNVLDQIRFLPEQLQANIHGPIHWLEQHQPLDCVAGPSGYGLPLMHARDCSQHDIYLMTLVRPQDRGQHQGLIHFSRLLRTFIDSALPVVFLPGVIHLPTVPAHRKMNRIDMGTADKLCVAAMAIALTGERTCCVIELGSAFSAIMVVKDGCIVDGVGGTCGPFGWRSMGLWDGEMAYLFSPLSKSDLFAGGVASCADRKTGELAFRESLQKTVAGLQAVHGFSRLILSGKLLTDEPALAQEIQHDLASLGETQILADLPGAWVKHAAQGSAIIADGLAKGQWSSLVTGLRIREASGSVLDWLHHPKAQPLREAF